jgi:hypothetical protein
VSWELEQFDGLVQIFATCIGLILADLWGLQLVCLLRDVAQYQQLYLFSLLRPVYCCWQIARYLRGTRRTHSRRRGSIFHPWTSMNAIIFNYNSNNFMLEIFCNFQWFELSRTTKCTWKLYTRIRIQNKCVCGAQKARIYKTKKHTNISRNYGFLGRFYKVSYMNGTILK